MTEESYLDLERLLADALRPIEPPDDLVTRVESTLTAITEQAAAELSSWAEELSEGELDALRDPRNWVRPAAAAAAGTLAGGALLVVGHAPPPPAGGPPGGRGGRTQAADPGQGITPPPPPLRLRSRSTGHPSRRCGGLGPVTAAGHSLLPRLRRCSTWFGAGSRVPAATPGESERQVEEVVGRAHREDAQRSSPRRRRSDPQTASTRYSPPRASA